MLLFTLHWLSVDVFAHDAQAASTVCTVIGFGPHMDVCTQRFGRTVTHMGNHFSSTLYIKPQVWLNCGPNSTDVLTNVFSKSIGFSSAPSFVRPVRRVLSSAVCEVSHCVTNVSISICARSRRPAKSPALIKPRVLQTNELTERKLHTNTHTQPIRKVVQYCA